MTKQVPDTLTRLAREFVVRDIMVPAADLLCAEDSADATDLLAANPDFDVIPIRNGGVLTAFLSRGATTPTAIGVHDLVSESTSILDTVDLLVRRPCLFVLVKSQVLGYVHFSDLNRSIVKLPFFVLLEAVERHLCDGLRSQINLPLLRATLSPSRLSGVQSKLERLQRSSSNLHLVSLLYFSELLSCATRLKAIRPTPVEQEALSQIRNLVAHSSSGQLVEAHGQVARLSSARDLCYSILGSSVAV